MMPSELSAKLYGDIAAAQRTIGTLEAERKTLLVPLHSGDATAKRRSDVIRGQVAKLAAEIADLESTASQLEPEVVREREDKVRVERAAAARKLDVAFTKMGQVAGRIDAALAELAEAMQQAVPVVDYTRRLAGSITMQAGNGDLGSMVIGHLLAIDNGPLRPLPEVLLARLASLEVIPMAAAGGFNPGAPPVGETLEAARVILAARVQSLLDDDQARLLPQDEEASALELEAV